MNVGFETIGNATLIAYDRVPVLVTDPWINGSAYFGSWGLSHTIPPEQMEACTASRFVWCSHGHPDHLNAESIGLFKGKQILLPDHHGGRIKNDLLAQGFEVQVLPDRKWVNLSDKIKVLCISDYNQDAILLIDINGRLVVNLNDAGDRGWTTFVQKTVAKYETSFLLCLSGYGDADMINFFTEDGTSIQPPAAKKFSVGRMIARKAESFGVKYFVPFSSMHRYQRSDSIWANEYTTGLDDYKNGFVSETVKILPAFVSFDCELDTYKEINPVRADEVILAPEDFGDRWSDMLEPADLNRIGQYFRAVEHLHTKLDFIRLKVGGKEHVIELRNQGFKTGLTFEVPRTSLMAAVEWEIFDDLLIGNFMKTTLHGKWPESKLYPNFTPYVAKYADNGLAKSKDELEQYFAAYRARMPVEYLRHTFERRCIDVFRACVPNDSSTYQMGKKIFWKARRLLAAGSP